MPEYKSSKVIDGVIRVHLTSFPDARGRFTETFRSEWFPNTDWRRVQMNRSDSAAGVLRGLHYHFHQVDFWYVQRGTIRVGLADLRPASPTFKSVEVFDMGEAADGHFGLFIPVGVAHGLYTLTDVTLTYVVNNYYDGADELGVAWDDPELNVPWGVDAPSISARDKDLPRFAEITADKRPI